MHWLFPSYKTVSPAYNFLILTVVLFTSYSSLWLFSERPLIATVPIALAGVAFLCYAKSWKLLIAAVIFSFFGTAHEAFFIRQGFWSYTTASFLAVPLYLPFIWANIGILAIALFKGILLIDHKRRLCHRPPLFLDTLILTVSTIIISLLCIFLFAQTPLILAGVFLCIDILYIIAMRSIPLALVGAVTLIAGSIADLAAVPLGIWQYPIEGTLSGIPPYIFIGWDIIGLLVVGTYLVLDAEDAPWAHFTRKYQGADESQSHPHTATKRSQSSTDTA